MRTLREERRVKRQVLWTREPRRDEYTPPTTRSRPLPAPTRVPRSAHYNGRPHAPPQEEEPHSAPRPLRGAERGADLTSPRGGREFRRVAATRSAPETFF